MIQYAPMNVSVGFVSVLFLAPLALMGGGGETFALRPEGHLKEFLSRQVTGLTGNRQAMGYPFDG